jgi:hypothetical protein
MTSERPKLKIPARRSEAERARLGNHFSLLELAAIHRELRAGRVERVPFGRCALDLDDRSPARAAYVRKMAMEGSRRSRARPLLAAAAEIAAE